MIRPSISASKALLSASAPVVFERPLRRLSSGDSSIGGPFLMFLYARCRALLIRPIHQVGALRGRCLLRLVVAAPPSFLVVSVSFQFFFYIVISFYPSLFFSHIPSSTSDTHSP